MKSKVGINVVLLSLLLVISSLTIVITPVGASKAEVEVIIGFTNKSQVSQAVLNSGGRVNQIYSIIPAMFANIPENALEALQRNPNVKYIEPNSEFFALEETIPWGIDRVFGDEVYSFPTWSSSIGSGVTVAVLDTGIDKNHDDLNVLDGTNTIDSTDWWVDGYGHGTHVAGTIAALDNGLGVVGVAPDVALYAVKVLDNSGSGNVGTILAGIEWAVYGPDGVDGTEDDSKIISMSLGGGYSASLEAACSSAFLSGSLLVASAGNSGNPPGRGDNVGYPAGYNSVIAVAATDQNDKRARFSSTGTAVELAAPGVDILSTYPGGYAIGSGTSMACPHVSGVAALVWAADPTLTNVEVRGILQTTAQDLGLSAEHQGYGLARADAAVDMAISTEPPTPVYYDLTIALTGSGSTDPIAGTYSYEEGSQVSVTATPASGWIFDHWQLDGVDVGTENSYTVTMDADHSLTAVFTEETQPVSYTLTMDQPTGLGAVSPEVGTHTYSEGEVVTVSATADVGYEFDHWIGDVADTYSATTTVTMDGHKIVQAVFTEITLPPAGTVSVESITYATTGGRNQDRHLLVTVTLKDDAGVVVSGASVSINLYLDSTIFDSATGTSGDNGTVTFQYNNAQSGTYTTTVTNVSADGLTWDGNTPTNSFNK